MPELDQVSNEIAAALIGLAPYDDDSRQRRGERHIKGGAAGFAMPSTCLASAAATLNNPVIKAFLTA